MEPPHGVARLAAADLDRLRKLCGLFSSDHAGERASAAAMADRLLRDRGLRWGDVLNEPTRPALNPLHEMVRDWPVRWRGAVQMCMVAGALSDRDRAFLATIAGYTHRPSPRQLEWLRNIVDRIIAGGS